MTLTTIDAVYRTRTPRSATLHDDARRYFPGRGTRSVGRQGRWPLKPLA